MIATSRCRFGGFPFSPYLNTTTSRSCSVKQDRIARCSCSALSREDDLELGKEARMNFPGTLSSANWTWRAEKGFDSDALAARIYAATKLYGRVGK